MDFVYRLKDSVVQYLSPPPKRRRTTGPGSPTNNASDSPLLIPTSEPRDRKAQAAVVRRVRKVYLSSPDTRNLRKRTRVEYEDDQETISPDDSISQVNVQEGVSEHSVESNADVEMESEVEAEDDEGEADGSEVTADPNAEQEVEMVSEEGSDGEADSDAVTDQSLLLGSGEEEVERDEEVIDEDASEVIEDGSAVEVEVEDGEAEQEGSGIKVGGSAVEEDEEGSEDPDQDSDERAVEEEIVEEEIDEEAVAQAKVEEYLARQAELVLIREEVEKVKAAGDWHPDEIFLFERISMRSYEEVISSDWRIDLPTLPEILFTKDPAKTIVKNNCRSSYSGVKALQRLLALGYRVRDLRCNEHPQFERLITRELKSYIRWAEYDGDYVKRRFIPVLSLVSAKRGQSTDSLSNSITKEMMFLASKHRENLALASGQDGATEYRRQPPLLYGIIVARSIVIFVTLDSANPEAKVRHLTHFDLTEYRMVVWNGFALAYIITMAKDYIISVRDDLEIDDTPDEDPDA